MRGVRAVLLPLVASAQLCAAFAPTFSPQAGVNRLRAGAKARLRPHVTSLATKEEAQDMEAAAVFEPAGLVQLENLPRLFTFDNIHCAVLCYLLCVATVDIAWSEVFDPSKLYAAAEVSLLRTFWYAADGIRLPRTGPLMANYKDIYLWSAGYMPVMSWLLWRLLPLNEQATASVEAWDAPMSVLYSAVTLFGCLAPAIAGKLRENGAAETASPAALEVKDEISDILKGNTFVNSLPCLFIPFIWCLCVRGQEWWDRVSLLHPMERPLMCLSVCVALLGAEVGILLMRLRAEEVASWRTVIAVGVALNLAFLVIPEAVFHAKFYSAFSEVRFYFE